MLSNSTFDTFNQISRSLSGQLLTLKLKYRKNHLQRPQTGISTIQGQLNSTYLVNNSKIYRKSPPVAFDNDFTVHVQFRHHTTQLSFHLVWPSFGFDYFKNKYHLWRDPSCALLPHWFQVRTYLSKLDLDIHRLFINFNDNHTTSHNFFSYFSGQTILNCKLVSKNIHH